MAFDDLYQEIILDHYKHPRNSTDLSALSDEHAHENPTCGDSLKLRVTLGSDGGVETVEFDGAGCAISMASASMMTEMLKGKPTEEALEIVSEFVDIMRGEIEPVELEKHGDLVALGGVVQYPLRIKCATLAWHAFEKSLEDLSDKN
jgi:nitrogen fixation protein NifU and related proteins